MLHFYLGWQFCLHLMMWHTFLLLIWTTLKTINSLNFYTSWNIIQDVLMECTSSLILDFKFIFSRLYLVLSLSRLWRQVCLCNQFVHGCMISWHVRNCDVFSTIIYRSFDPAFYLIFPFSQYLVNKIIMIRKPEDWYIGSKVICLNNKI